MSSSVWTAVQETEQAGLPVYSVMHFSGGLKPMETIFGRQRQLKKNLPLSPVSSENLLNRRRIKGSTQEEHAKRRRTQEVGHALPERGQLQSIAASWVPLPMHGSRLQLSPSALRSARSSSLVPGRKISVPVVGRLLVASGCLKAPSYLVCPCPGDARTILPERLI
ncbi:hypothetical protein NDU88_005858 [Pleurodeles waltl]|uniref:Uncharacterized protein n=1 Tax=Pleurodeles waltl TaxID=8319 RepID=A0AAV7QJG3_PLEWA|nr:hypothetical protein NDU88_005858 [Pleurodeles waltl]